MHGRPMLASICADGQRRPCRGRAWRGGGDAPARIARGAAVPAAERPGEHARLGEARISEISPSCRVDWRRYFSARSARIWSRTFWKVVPFSASWRCRVRGEVAIAPATSPIEQAENGISDRIAPSIRDRAACGVGDCLPASTALIMRRERSSAAASGRASSSAWMRTALRSWSNASVGPKKRLCMPRSSGARWQNCTDAGCQSGSAWLRISLQNSAMPSSITCRSSIGDCLAR